MGDCNVPFYFGRRAGGGLGQGTKAIQKMKKHLGGYMGLLSDQI